MTPAAGGERLEAPAKLNLSLQITGRRADGYHLLDSVVVFTDFGDSLTVKPGTGADSIEIKGPFAGALSRGSDNICLQAITAFREAGGAIGPLAITLEKHIPVGAGLGGGSSDAAAILRYLERNASSCIGPEPLAELALALGADVPVCLAGGATHVRGIGDILHPVDPAPRGHVVLSRPEAMLSTPAVFSAFTAGGQGFTKPAVEPTGRTAKQIAEAGNDLLAAARDLCPEITTLITELNQCPGAEAVQMTGSGSACFALFPDAALAAAAAARLTAAGRWAVASSF